ncbi:MAG: mannose-6-phosphate isomerase [Verrucomicrobia bacterium]|nr:MAG: mannose-6-phosphate isomerase [Verrucomicrobiota bacterium]
MANLSSPLTFNPLFQERIWGGSKLAELFGKKIPPNKRIGESWEIVDRPEAQSIVRNGPLSGRSLHALWVNFREELFGELPDVPRFPLLIKLLDAQEKLSLQVHPPQEIAESLGGEAKSEFWYVVAAEPNAEIFVGLRKSMTRDQFDDAVHSGTVADCVHAIRMKSGAAMFLPSGRFHAIGAGNLLVEVQQNSDTTYRVFDWNRVDDQGKPRQLHVDQALQCIDFNDVAPKPITPKGELLARHELFEVQKWNLKSARDIAPIGQFAIVLCLSGALQCAGGDFTPGEFFLVPASLRDRSIHPRGEGTSLLRITIPI